MYTVLYSDPTMFSPHVRVYSPAAIDVGKGLHAHPAHVRPAPPARHMVAAPVLLQVRAAARTSLDPMLLLPPLKRLVSAGRIVLELGTGQALVKLDVARRADAGDTRGATEDVVVRGRAVNRLAVGGGTVMVLLRPTMDVRQKRGFEQTFFLSRGQKGADSVEGDSTPTRSAGSTGLPDLGQTNGNYL